MRTNTTTSSQRMTDKQEAFIVSLANKVYGTRAGYLSQVRNHLGLSSSKCQRLSKAEASAIIDQLQAQL